MSEPNTIYRVQHRIDGRGPYRPGFSQVWVDPDNDGSRCPLFWAEFGLNVFGGIIPGHHAGCGFRTLAQLHRWFSHTELQRLRSFGYIAARLDADKILAESEHQLVFCRATPFRLGWEPALHII